MYRTYDDLPSEPVASKSTEDVMTGTWRTIRPVINEDRCIRCYMCWKFCPDMSMVVEKEGDYPRVDLDHCKGCGICSNECPRLAIRMEREIL
ncbi:MAG: 4Fe-4S binding protein [Methanomassiliicoccus sp.]|nr:4Fe-4S binding protein [Methanomassiliicoccus sp.]